MTAAVMLELEPHRLLGFPLFPFIDPVSHTTYLNHLHRCKNSLRTVSEVIIRGGITPVPVELLSLRYVDAEHGPLYRTAL